jgi:hypothetical protein
METEPVEQVMPESEPMARRSADENPQAALSSAEQTNASEQMNDVIDTSTVPVPSVEGGKKRRRKMRGGFTVLGGLSSIAGGLCAGYGMAFGGEGATIGGANTGSDDDSRNPNKFRAPLKYEGTDLRLSNMGQVKTFLVSIFDMFEDVKYSQAEFMSDEPFEKTIAKFKAAISGKRKIFNDAHRVQVAARIVDAYNAAFGANLAKPTAANADKIMDLMYGIAENITSVLFSPSESGADEVSFNAYINSVGDLCDIAEASEGVLENVKRGLKGEIEDSGTKVLVDLMLEMIREIKAVANSLKGPVSALVTLHPQLNGLATKIARVDERLQAVKMSPDGDSKLVSSLLSLINAMRFYTLLSQHKEVFTNLQNMWEDKTMGKDKDAIMAVIVKNTKDLSESDLKLIQDLLSNFENKEFREQLDGLFAEAEKHRGPGVSGGEEKTRLELTRESAERTVRIMFTDFCKSYAKRITAIYKATGEFVEKLLAKDIEITSEMSEWASYLSELGGKLDNGNLFALLNLQNLESNGELIKNVTDTFKAITSLFKGLVQKEGYAQFSDDINKISGLFDELEQFLLNYGKTMRDSLKHNVSDPNKLVDALDTSDIKLAYTKVMQMTNNFKAKLKFAINARKFKNSLRLSAKLMQRNQAEYDDKTTKMIKRELEKSDKRLAELNKTATRPEQKAMIEKLIKLERTKWYTIQGVDALLYNAQEALLLHADIIDDMYFILSTIELPNVDKTHIQVVGGADDDDDINSELLKYDELYSKIPEFNDDKIIFITRPLKEFLVTYTYIQFLSEIIDSIHNVFIGAVNIDNVFNNRCMNRDINTFVADTFVVSLNILYNSMGTATSNLVMVTDIAGSSIITNFKTKLRDVYANLKSKVAKSNYVDECNKYKIIICDELKKLKKLIHINPNKFTNSALTMALSNYILIMYGDYELVNEWQSELKKLTNKHFGIKNNRATNFSKYTFMDLTFNDADWHKKIINAAQLKFQGTPDIVNKCKHLNILHTITSCCDVILTEISNKYLIYYNNNVETFIYDTINGVVTKHQISDRCTFMILITKINKSIANNKICTVHIYTILRDTMYDIFTNTDDVLRNLFSDDTPLETLGHYLDNISNLTNLSYYTECNLSYLVDPNMPDPKEFVNKFVKNLLKFYNNDRHVPIADLLTSINMIKNVLHSTYAEYYVPGLPLIGTINDKHEKLLNLILTISIRKLNHMGDIGTRGVDVNASGINFISKMIPDNSTDDVYNVDILLDIGFIAFWNYLDLITDNVLEKTITIYRNKIGYKPTKWSDLAYLVENYFSKIPIDNYIYKRNPGAGNHLSHMQSQILHDFTTQNYTDLIPSIIINNNIGLDEFLYDSRCGIAANSGDIMSLSTFFRNLDTLLCYSHLVKLTIEIKDTEYDYTKLFYDDKHEPITDETYSKINKHTHPLFGNGGLVKYYKSQPENKELAFDYYMAIQKYNAFVTMLYNSTAARGADVYPNHMRILKVYVYNDSNELELTICNQIPDTNCLNLPYVNTTESKIVSYIINDIHNLNEILSTYTSTSILFGNNYSLTNPTITDKQINEHSYNSDISQSKSTGYEAITLHQKDKISQSTTICKINDKNMCSFMIYIWKITYMYELMVELINSIEPPKYKDITNGITQRLHALSPTLSKIVRNKLTNRTIHEKVKHLFSDCNHDIVIMKSYVKLLQQIANLSKLVSKYVILNETDLTIISNASIFNNDVDYENIIIYNSCMVSISNISNMYTSYTESKNIITEHIPKRIKVKTDIITLDKFDELVKSYKNSSFRILSYVIFQVLKLHLDKQSTKGGAITTNAITQGALRENMAALHAYTYYMPDSTLSKFTSDIDDQHINSVSKPVFSIVSAMFAYLSNILTVVSAFKRPTNLAIENDIIKQTYVIDNYGFGPDPKISALALLGGAQAEVITDAAELYIRLPLLAEFYLHVLIPRSAINSQEPYISLITSQNNPNGTILYLLLEKLKSLPATTDSIIYDNALIIALITEINKLYNEKKNISDVITNFIEDISTRLSLVRGSDLNSVYEREKIYTSNINTEHSTEIDPIDLIDDGFGKGWEPLSNTYKQTIDVERQTTDTLFKPDMDVLINICKKINSVMLTNIPRPALLAPDNILEDKIRDMRRQLQNVSDPQERVSIIVSEFTGTSISGLQNTLARLYVDEFIMVGVNSLLSIENFIDRLNSFISTNEFSYAFEYLREMAAVPNRLIDVTFGPTTYCNKVKMSINFDEMKKLILGLLQSVTQNKSSLYQVNLCRKIIDTITVKKTSGTGTVNILLNTVINQLTEKLQDKFINNRMTDEKTASIVNINAKIASINITSMEFNGNEEILANSGVSVNRYLNMYLRNVVGRANLRLGHVGAFAPANCVDSNTLLSIDNIDFMEADKHGTSNNANTYNARAIPKLKMIHSYYKSYIQRIRDHFADINNSLIMENILQATIDRVNFTLTFDANTGKLTNITLPAINGAPNIIPVMSLHVLESAKSSSGSIYKSAIAGMVAAVAAYADPQFTNTGTGISVTNFNAISNNLNITINYINNQQIQNRSIATTNPWIKIAKEILFGVLPNGNVGQVAAFARPEDKQNAEKYERLVKLYNKIQDELKQLIEIVSNNEDNSPSEISPLPEKQTTLDYLINNLSANGNIGSVNGTLINGKVGGYTNSLTSLNATFANIVYLLLNTVSQDNKIPKMFWDPIYSAIKSNIDFKESIDINLETTKEQYARLLLPNKSQLFTERQQIPADILSAYGIAANNLYDARGIGNTDYINSAQDKIRKLSVQNFSELYSKLPMFITTAYNKNIATHPIPYSLYLILITLFERKTLVAPQTSYHLINDITELQASSLAILATELPYIEQMCRSLQQKCVFYNNFLKSFKNLEDGSPSQEKTAIRKAAFLRARRNVDLVITLTSTVYSAVSNMIKQLGRSSEYFELSYQQFKQSHDIARAVDNPAATPLLPLSGLLFVNNIEVMYDVPGEISKMIKLNEYPTYVHLLHALKSVLTSEIVDAKLDNFRGVRYILSRYNSDYRTQTINESSFQKYVEYCVAAARYIYTVNQNLVKFGESAIFSNNEYRLYETPQIKCTKDKLQEVLNYSNTPGETFDKMIIEYYDQQGATIQQVNNRLTYMQNNISDLNIFPIKLGALQSEIPLLYLLSYAQVSPIYTDRMIDIDEVIKTKLQNLRMDVQNRVKDNDPLIFKGLDWM